MHQVKETPGGFQNKWDSRQENEPHPQPYLSSNRKTVVRRCRLWSSAVCFNLDIVFCLNSFYLNRITNSHMTTSFSPHEISRDRNSNFNLGFILHIVEGGGPRVVVSTAAFHARVRGSVPVLGGLKETKMFLPHPRVKVSIVGSLRDREVACSALDRQGSNFESCV